MLDGFHIQSNCYLLVYDHAFPSFPYRDDFVEFGCRCHKKLLMKFRQTKAGHESDILLGPIWERRSYMRNMWSYNSCWTLPWFPAAKRVGYNKWSTHIEACTLTIVCYLLGEVSVFHLWIDQQLCRTMQWGCVSFCLQVRMVNSLTITALFNL